MQKRIKKAIEKFNSTRLQMLEASKYVAGNSSILMQKTARAVDVTTTTGAAYLGARNAAIDVAHGLEDYACSDYKCLALDTVVLKYLQSVLLHLVFVGH